MLELAAEQTVDSVREEYEQTYREMRAAGYTAVGEFHYLGAAEARAAIAAAEAAEIEIVLLLSAYARGGLERFRQASAADYLRDVEALRGEVLARAGCVSQRTTVVHATHATDTELDLLADAGARVCVCPTTEANLGDGFAPVERICERGIGVCIGSDSNVRIDPLEELRELEGIARRQSGRRNVVSVERLLCYGADEGAGALGLERWADATVDVEHPSLRGLEDADVFAALVFGCSAEVLRA